MSWRYVYDYLKRNLENAEFQKQNAVHNPNDPETALLVAVEHLYVELKRAHAQTELEKWQRTVITIN